MKYQYRILQQGTINPKFFIEFRRPPSSYQHRSDSGNEWMGLSGNFICLVDAEARVEYNLDQDKEKIVVKEYLTDDQ